MKRDGRAEIEAVRGGLRDEVVDLLELLRLAIASTAVMPCITACIPARID